MPAAVRLQKILSQAGVASRRRAEVLIKEGKVRINGRVVSELGAKANPYKDKIEVNGKRLASQAPVYYVLNKPRGMVSTLRDPEGRASLAELVRSITERVYPVGRLDYHTSGVLLLTNDGDMAHALMHPRKGAPKTYVVKASGHFDEAHLQALRQGVRIGRDETTASADVHVLSEEPRCTWLRITLREGKNRQIHRMLETLGHKVLRLSRLSYAGITAEGLKPGQLRPLTSRELLRLKRAYQKAD